MALRPKLKITHDRRRWDAMLRRISKPAPSAAVGVKDTPRDDGHTNSEIGTLHEFGIGVPQRSFIRAGAEKAKTGLLFELGVAVTSLLFSRAVAIGAVTRAAIKAKQSILAHIDAGVPPALAPSTVARKGHSKALVDTGQLVDAIDYEVSS